MSAQNIPLKSRIDLCGSSRIPATETIHVRAATVGGAARAQLGWQELPRFSADPFRLAGVRCIAALWRVKSLLRHRSDRPKRRLTTDQMAFVAGRHVALSVASWSLRTHRHGVISDFEWTFVHFCSCLPSMQIMTRPLARFAPSA